MALACLSSNHNHPRSPLQNVVSKHCATFAGFDQQDSLEFLLFLLDGLHEDMNEVCCCFCLTVGYSNCSIYAFYGVDFHCSSLGTSYGQLLSVIECRHCDKRSSKFDAFMCLSLPLPGYSTCSLQVSSVITTTIFTDLFCTILTIILVIINQSINAASGVSLIRQQLFFVYHYTYYACSRYDQIYVFRYSASTRSPSPRLKTCMGLFGSPEDMKDQWFCPRCKRRTDATKRLTVWRLPTYLIIHFKRPAYIYFTLLSPRVCVCVCKGRGVVELSFERPLPSVFVTEPPLGPCGFCTETEDYILIVSLKYPGLPADWSDSSISHALTCRLTLV
ncbi:unnamed protein product [Echinostoma caproni]|uniref:ubiquitinyl hydrolase 1 n=1 Tax=Echinostoma caproni TaxID=27848 RepID=A0A183ATZ3_9TREM|nr:unnamed protein product [Echinostoma caproni]